MTTSKQLSLSWIAALIVLALACPQAAHAGGAVSSCDEAHLKAEMLLFPGGTFTFKCSGTITLTEGTIVISTNTTIDGSGHSVTISGGKNTRVFEVDSGVTFNLKNITVANGFPGGISDVNFNGGGMINNGTVTVTNCTFDDNSAGGPVGDGGGIYNNGQLTVTNSSFIHNFANDGAGIDNKAGILQVTDSVFYNNISGNSGGGISNHGFVIITNSTFNNNFAHNDGGNIANHLFAVLYNDTLARGSTAFPSTGERPTGDNVSNDGEPVYVQNTIFAYPQGGISNSNCIGSLTDVGGNLQFSTTSSDKSCVGTFVDPDLGKLQNNGGPTQTLALLTGSPAIDNGIDALCPPTDQRGVIRPQGPHCDIGAYEANTALSLVGAVLSDFNAFLSSLLSEGVLDKVSARVIIPLEHSLDPNLWPEGDGNHINGGEVFTLQRDVVDGLSEFILDPTQLTYINNLIMADRTLAVVAINNKGCGANPNPGPNVNVSDACTQAAAEVAAGDTSAGMGKYGEAIDHYLRAWQLTTP